jgi:hypothetical protein
MSLKGLEKVETLLKDELNPVYSHSFDISTSIHALENALKYFNEYGYVVISNVFDSNECTNTRQAMWEILESSNPEFKHEDQSTWGKLKAKGLDTAAVVNCVPYFYRSILLSAFYTGHYGLSIRGPSFHPCFVRNR